MKNEHLEKSFTFHWSDAEKLWVSILKRSPHVVLWRKALILSPYTSAVMSHPYGDDGSHGDVGSSCALHTGDVWIQWLDEHLLAATSPKCWSECPCRGHISYVSFHAWRKTCFNFEGTLPVTGQNRAALSSQPTSFVDSIFLKTQRSPIKQTCPLGPDETGHLMLPRQL